MKILVVHNAYQTGLIGGEDVVVRQEIQGLKEILGSANVFEYIVSNDDVNFIKLAFTLWSNQTHAKKISEMVRQHQITIVHIHNFFPLLTPSVFKAAKKAGATVIHTLHNFRWWCLSGIFYRKGKQNCERCIHKKFGWPAIIHRCYRGSFIQSLAGSLAFSWYRLKRYTKHIDAYFVLSTFQQEKLKSLLSGQRVLLKPNSIAPPVHCFPSLTKKHYIFVGRLEPAKGIELLLSTWSQLPSHFELIVIGEGKERKRLSQQFGQPNIYFAGPLPHATVLEHIAKAKYLVHPSLTYETFGLTLVEALACGTPVIGIDKGPRAEFIQSGKNGFLCQSDDLKKTLLDSFEVTNYPELCQNAIESGKAFYTQTIMAKQVALYQQIMAESNSG